MQGLEVAERSMVADCLSAYGRSLSGADVAHAAIVGDVPSTVKRFWPLPEGFDPAKTYSEQKPWFEQRRCQYPEELMREYDALQRVCKEGGSCLATFDFLFRNRLYNGFLPHMTHLTGAGFQALCPQIASRPHARIADLGCGDGRIAIGLALHLPGIERIYAIDILPSALERMAEHVSKLSLEERQLVDGRIIPLLGDYMASEFQERFRQEHGRADLVLGAFPYSYEECIASVPAFGDLAVCAVHAPRSSTAAIMDAELALYNDVFDLRSRTLDWVQLPCDCVMISESSAQPQAGQSAAAAPDGQVSTPLRS